MAKHKLKKPSRQWIDLFFAVADFCDGDLNDVIAIDDIVRAYEVLVVGDGSAIYEEAVDAGNKRLKQLYG